MGLFLDFCMWGQLIRQYTTGVLKSRSSILCVLQQLVFVLSGQVCLGLHDCSYCLRLPIYFEVSLFSSIQLSPYLTSLAPLLAEAITDKDTTLRATSLAVLVGVELGGLNG